jgi:hypothetical protein
MRRTAVTLVPIVAIAALASLCLSGCQQLFTTSLASALARDKITISGNLSTTQAADLAAQAKANDDAQLASALVAALVDQIASTTDPAAKASLEASAASSAIVASGAGSALASLFSLVSGGDASSLSETTVSSMLATIQAGASADVITALSYLDPNSGFDAAASGLSSSDYLFAAVILAASVVPEGADPATFNTSTLSAEDKTTFELAGRLLGEASTLAGSGSGSADLIASLGDSFSL